VSSLAQAVTDAVAAAIPSVGEPEWDLATEDKPMPFCVLHEQPSGPEDYDTEGTALCDRQVLVAIYALTKDQADDLRDAVRDRLVGHALTLTSGYALQCVSAGESSGLDPDRDAEGEEVWQSTVLLEFLAERPAPAQA